MNPPNAAILSALAAAVLGCAAPALGSPAQTAFYEGFEGPEVTWRDVGGDARYRIEFHGRVQGEAHVGDGCERVRLVGADGTQVLLAHEVGRARVIDELLPTVWVKSDRAGLQLLARVVFPRTADPRTGQPLTAVLAGSSYTKVGRWEQLRIDNVPQLVARQARVLRAQAGPAVDEREAVLDRVLLNIYGGPGVTNVWMDDLDLAGFVQAPLPHAPAPSADSSGGWRGAGTAPPGPGPAPGPGIAPPSPADQLPGAPPSHAGPRLNGSILMLGDREVFPRIVQHQGEPLAVLRRLGFTAVWLPRAPGPELQAEAEQLDLWLVCPPPVPADPARAEPGVGPPSQIGPEFDRVLAWDVSIEPASENVERIRQWSEHVRRADARRARPLVCRADAELKALSRVADVLWMARSPLGTGLELADYARWLRQRPLLVRPGTPLWTSVQTQPAQELRAQWALLGRGQPLPGAFPPEQIRLLAYTAVTAGSRALVCDSDTRLDADDPDTRARAAVLELINLELDALEPWTAAGSAAGLFPGSPGQVRGAVLRTDRARLALPIWSAPGAQFVAGQSAAHQVAFVVPGVPEAHDAYQIVGGSLRPLRRERVPGGVRVTLEEFDLTAAVLLTQDPLAVSATTRRAQAAARRAAELHRELAALKLAGAEQLLRTLPTGAAPAAQSSEWLAAARAEVQKCDGHLAAKDYAQAALAAQRAMRPLRLLERTVWEAAVAPLEAPVAAPAAVSLRTLPWHLEMAGRVSVSVPGDNRLPAGDFEDPGAMLQWGWRHYQRPAEGVLAFAELAPEAAGAGRLGLRLAAAPADPQKPPELVEAPPVWVTSPGVAVEAGELVCIQGWVRLPGPIAGSVDGLMIVDSLGGGPLALRITRTGDWQRFALFRVAPRAGAMSVSFVLTGLGEAWLDDVTIQPVQAAPPAM